MAHAVDTDAPERNSYPVFERQSHLVDELSPVARREEGKHGADPRRLDVGRQRAAQGRVVRLGRGGAESVLLRELQAVTTSGVSERDGRG